jgi:hypothetical protein
VLCVRAAGGLRDRKDRRGRRDQACPLRPLRYSAVTTVTGMIAVIAVIGGFVVPSPILAARTVAKGVYLPRPP